MNWAIKIISKTLMTKISHISWRVTTKGATTKAFTVFTFDLGDVNFLFCELSLKLVQFWFLFILNNKVPIL